MEFNPEIIKNFNFNNITSYQKDVIRAKNFLQLKQAIGENWFFKSLTLNNLINELPHELNFGFSASSILLINDSVNIIVFNWKGIGTDGMLLAKEVFNFDRTERTKIYLRAQGDLRIWVF